MMDDRTLFEQEINEIQNFILYIYFLQLVFYESGHVDVIGFTRLYAILAI